MRQLNVRGGAMWPVWLTLVTSVKCPSLTLATNQSPVMVSTKMKHQSLTGVGRKELIKRNKTYHNCSLKCTCYTFAKNCQVILSTIFDFVYFAKLMHIWAINFTLKRLFCWVFALYIHDFYFYLSVNKCALKIPISTSRNKQGCGNLIQRWVYDGNTGDCKHFLFSSCDGEDMYYQSQWECRSKCVGKFICTLWQYKINKSMV